MREERGERKHGKNAVQEPLSCGGSSRPRGQ